MNDMPRRWTMRRARANTSAENAAAAPEASPETSVSKPPQTGKPEWAMSRREIERVLRERAGLPPVRRRWPWVIVALILLAAVGAAGFWQMQRMTEAPQAETAAAPEAASDPARPLMELVPEEYAALEPISLMRMVKVTGTLQPVRQAQLSSQTGGQVEEVTIEPGDSVAKGDLLVQVDVETLTIDLDLARSNAAATQAQLELAEAQLERTEALLDRGVATSSTLDQARSNVEGLRANIRALEDQVRAAELRLRNATMRAPFDGTISARNVDPGQYVTVGTPLLTVVDLSSVEMQANAPVAMGGALRPGQPVEVTVDGMTERRFDGVVERINPVAAEGTRTIPVYIRIDNEGGPLLGGMFATGQVITERVDDALAVPAAALREDAGGFYVLRIINGQLEQARVETGGEWAGQLIQIVAGLAPGEVIVTAPLPELAPGDAVELSER